MKALGHSNAIVVALLVIVIIWAGLVNMGLAYVVIVGGSAAVAYFAWLLTTYKNPADPEKVLPLYLLLVAAEMIHMIEEVVAGFSEDFSLLFNVTITGKTFAASFLIVSAVGVLAAVGLIYRNPIANYFVWLFAIGPGIVNGIAHFVFPVLAGAFYFPGLITVLMPFIAGILLLRKLVSERGSGTERKVAIGNPAV